MTVTELLDSARDAATKIRRMEYEDELMTARVGPQGYSMGIHSKGAVLDPMRKVDDLIDWQSRKRDLDWLQEPIDEAWDVVKGIRKLTDDFTVEIVTRYYLQAETWPEIVDGDERAGIKPMSERVSGYEDMSRTAQISSLRSALESSLRFWNRIGIARLKRMGEND